MTKPSIYSEIRRVRHEMSAEINHDPRKIVAYYAEIQAELSERLVDHSNERNSDGSTHPAEPSSASSV